MFIFNGPIVVVDVVVVGANVVVDVVVVVEVVVVVGAGTQSITTD
jgi:hypothetical protein